MIAPYPSSWPAWADVVAALPPAWLQQSRWFRRKSERIRTVELYDGLDLTPFTSLEDRRILWLLLTVTMESGEIDRYQAPVVVEPRRGPSAEGIFEISPATGVPGGDSGAFQVREAMDEPALHTAVQSMIRIGLRVEARNGTFRFDYFPARGTRQSRPLAQTSSNTLVLLKGDEVVKYLRRVEPGLSPELEMNQFFAEHGDFVNLPPLTGVVRYLPLGGPEHTLVMVQLFVENEGDLWAWSLQFLDGLIRGVIARPGRATPEEVDNQARDYYQGIRRLAEVLAHMHRTLTAAGADPGFRPEPITRPDLEQWRLAMTAGAGDIFRRIAVIKPGDDPILGEFFRALPDLRARIGAAFDRLPGLDPAGWVKCRVHGDFHLGQALKVEDDFFIMDFEGEPLKDQAQRVARYSPLKDVAGLLRSFNYAMYAALFAFDEKIRLTTGDFQTLERLLHHWNRQVETIFRETYFQAMNWTANPDLSAFLAVLKLEKAVYELDYEINNRPAWLRIPVSGIGACLEEILHDEQRT